MKIPIRYPSVGDCIANAGLNDSIPSGLLVTRAIRCGGLRLQNPNGIPSLSPGLARNAQAERGSVSRSNARTFKTSQFIPHAF